MQGYVHCACYWQGRARPHPHPHLLEQSPGRLELNSRACQKALDDHDEWLEKGCCHPFMQLVAEEIGEHSDLETVRLAFEPAARAAPHILELASSHEPPPPWPADRSRQVLEQISALRATPPSVPAHQVFDVQTGELLFETPVDKVYCYCGDGALLGVGPDGLWLKRCDKVVFRTNLLRQEDELDGTYRLTPEGGSPVTATAAFLP